MNRNLYLTNNKDVKKFINNSYLFLILFIILISKNFIFSLFKPRYTFNESILLSSLYEQINKINIIKGYDYKDNITYAKVINNNIYAFRKELKLICDTKNISKNDLVIYDKYLIGTVKSIYKDFIIVKMITNNDFIIQGFGKNELGILKYDDNKLIFSSNENLNINDEIYISNLTGYNEKIVLGTIKGIIYIPEKVYEIKPVDINKIDYLVVLSRNKQ